MSTPFPTPHDYGVDPTGEPAGDPYQQPGFYPPPTWIAPATEDRGPLARADRWWAKGLVALATAIVIAAIGFPLGVAWSAIAPWLPGIKQSDGVYLVDVEGEQRAAQEGWFVILSVAAGVILAILAWLLLRRFRGAAIAAALAIGGGAAGWLAWWFGHDIGRPHALHQVSTAKIGTIIKFPVDLRIKNAGNVALWHGWLPHIGGELLYLGIAAVIVYMVLAGFSSSQSLHARGKLAAAPQPAGPAPFGQAQLDGQAHQQPMDPLAPLDPPAPLDPSSRAQP